MTAEDNKDMSVICFGGEDWWYKNRGHIDMQLMRRFARIGTTLYVNSIVMQKPTLKRNVGGGKSFTQKLLRKAKSIFRGLRESGAGFWVYSPFSLPVHHIAWASPINEFFLRYQIGRVARKLQMDNPIIWIACPTACDTALKLRKNLLVYQRTDRFEEFPNVDGNIISSFDRKLKNNADLTIFVSEALFNKESSQCKKAFHLDHGVDFDMFASAQNSKGVPADISDIKRPRVGFFGSIDSHTSDIELLTKVVDMLPKMNFVFVGNPSIDCGDLLSKKNVAMLGQKPYEQIPHYGKCFDVAIMPWRQNEWIEGCNPIKLKEYLALGKPIVSTPFLELNKYLDVVYQARTPEEFAKCIKRALDEDNDKRITARRKKVKKATWDSKAQLVLKELFGPEQIFEEMSISV